ncbi:MAG TPA: sugar phosphate nucleotidyltransferase, partial [Microvirga sp.]|nr:sugar phosphate nucleotidyltransferase [Microvirga sp.]
MWGIVPAAGIGSRIQPLAFSKELLPVGSRLDNGVERPCAVSEYLVERMIHGGADKICFVISPGKSDIMEYYGASYGNASIAYVVQPEPRGLCDAIFRAAPLIPPDEGA